MDDLNTDPNASPANEKAINSNGQSQTVVSAPDNPEKNGDTPKKISYRKFRHAPTWIEAACAVALVVITGLYTHYARQQVQTAQNTLAEIIKQSPEITKSADAAKSAADIAAASLTISERPWVSLADIEITSPLTFDNRGGLIEIRYVLKNTGKSPAIASRWRAKLVVLPMKKLRNEEISDVQSAMCDPLRELQNSFLDVSIFPGDLDKSAEGLGLYPGEIETGLQERELGPFKHKGYISATLIACIDYQSSFGPTHYQTRYAFDLGVPIATGAYMADFKPSGRHPDLRLIYFSQSAN